MNTQLLQLHEQECGTGVALANLPVPDGFRYCPMGDSRTYGNTATTADKSYRGIIAAKFAASSWPNARSIGNQNSNPPTPALGLWHEGVPSRRIDDLITMVATVFAAPGSAGVTGTQCNPDLATILIGTNNAADTPAMSRATYVSKYQQLLSTMWSGRPRLRVVIIPELWDDEVDDPARAAANDGYYATFQPGQEMATWLAANHPGAFVIADSRGPLGPGDGVGWNTTDWAGTGNVHPNDSGHAKLATVVWAAIQAAMALST